MSAPPKDARLCELCHHRAETTIELRTVGPICDACQTRLARWIHSSTPEQRKQIWEEGSRLGEQATETDEETGEKLQAWPEFLAGIEAAVGGGPPLLEAGARIDLGSALIDFGMNDEGVREYAKALTLTEDAAVRTQALALILDRSRLKSDGLDQLKLLLFPS